MAREAMRPHAESSVDPDSHEPNAMAALASRLVGSTASYDGPNLFTTTADGKR